MIFLWNWFELNNIRIGIYNTLSWFPINKKERSSKKVNIFISVYEIESIFLGKPDGTLHQRKQCVTKRHKKDMLLPEVDVFDCIWRSTYDASSYCVCLKLLGADLQSRI